MRNYVPGKADWSFQFIGLNAFSVWNKEYILDNVMYLMIV